jgi:hypothetical protein
VQQEDCVTLLRLGFNQFCEIVGRASAIVALVGMVVLVFAATANRIRTLMLDCEKMKAAKARSALLPKADIR